MKKIVSEGHINTAVEGYLKALSIIDEDDIVISIKRDRSGSFEVEIEKESE